MSTHKTEKKRIADAASEADLRRFKTFDVVRVPFPFTDRNTSKNRPALILSSNKTFNTASGHSVMAMITSEDNAPWPQDCIIHNLQAAGLPAASKIRFKLFTLDHRLIRGVLGQLDAADQAAVKNTFACLFTDVLA
jgi:mRNA interferase MazF